MLRPVREWISHHRYESATEAPQKRDLRLDLLRGFCVFVMIVDHVGAEASWLYWFTGGKRRVAPTAEGFGLPPGIRTGGGQPTPIPTQSFRAPFGKGF